MNRNNFTVLRGGLLDTADTSEKIFESAYVTNTRLMGVISMYIHFKLPDNPTMSDLHQFFYFDAEEYGFETYRSLLGDDPEALEDISRSMISGLGGENVPITLREAMSLLQEYIRFNRQAKLPLPDGFTEYEFLLRQSITLTEPERYVLMKKQCCQIHTSCERINYFLMRVFGRDFSAAAFLTDGACQLDEFPSFKAATLCKNHIEPGDTPNSYICESLVEFDDHYHITISTVQTNDSQITEFSRISDFKVSPAEASMMLSRSEFITVFELLDLPESFTKTATQKTTMAMIHPHESGTLYMLFHPDNKHVNKWEYRLNDDVMGMYFISNGGQLLCAAYTIDDIRALEHDLSNSSFAKKLIPTAKYEFQEPVLYEFIQSGFEEFNTFVDAIRTGEES
ncbi:hypothetical protein ACDL92_08015 [Ihubacter sp. mB4P-1]|uniref:hypothetical protein n=1 Tax=Ihubacter sp. mB4P-1 TaxID=3242370 RepID=UPI003C7D603B